MDTIGWLSLSGMVRCYEDQAFEEWVFDGSVSPDTAEKLRRAREAYDAQLPLEIDRPGPAILLTERM